MAFILAEQRDADCAGAFKRYREYVAAQKNAFPSGAFALASSVWYFDASEHRCPHDAWLENITISKTSTGGGSGQRVTAIRIRLLGRYNDGFIEFFYPHVFRYALESSSSSCGLGDWRYDEFRVSPEGRVIHEIEWAGSRSDEEAGSRWIIEASDVQYQWLPK